MTRISKVQDFHNFVGGKDNDNIFEEGVVYNITKILGVITLTPIGKHSKFTKDGRELIKMNLTEIISDGSHLLTADEVKKI